MLFLFHYFYLSFSSLFVSLSLFLFFPTQLCLPLLLALSLAVTLLCLFSPLFIYFSFSVSHSLPLLTYSLPFISLLFSSFLSLHPFPSLLPPSVSLSSSWHWERIQSASVWSVRVICRALWRGCTCRTPRCSWMPARSRIPPWLDPTTGDCPSTSRAIRWAQLPLYMCISFSFRSWIGLLMITHLNNTHSHGSILCRVYKSETGETCWTLI